MDCNKIYAQQNVYIIRVGGVHLLATVVATLSKSKV
jgi:hypothetical protein